MVDQESPGSQGSMASLGREAHRGLRVSATWPHATRPTVDCGRNTTAKAHVIRDLHVRKSLFTREASVIVTISTSQITPQATAVIEVCVYPYRLSSRLGLTSPHFMTYS